MLKISRHFDTAWKLMVGIGETFTEWNDEKKDERWPWFGQAPEHSKESVIRRCIQIRQELLQVMKELKSL